MYFWIVGDNTTIISEALSYLHTTNFSQPRKNIIIFDTMYPERIPQCAVIIKWWEIYTSKQLSDIESIKSDIWVETKELWSHLKKQIDNIKRFKLVELIHTDLEIKDHGTEIINIDNSNYGVVQWYQNISLYEAIDFGKPVGWMNIGMMPSKLALTLINIWIWEHESISQSKENWKTTIRDPFCWFWTTNFLVNALWHNTIASDINVTSVKQNTKRRSSQSFYKNESKELIIKQDVTEDFKNPLFRHADIVVSEWWLWHIVTSRTAPFETNSYAQEVKKLYTSFAKNTTTLAQKNDKSLTLVITIPVRLKYDISVSEDICNEFISLWRNARLVTQPYSREKQLVGRQILIWTFKI